MRFYDVTEKAFVRRTKLSLKKLLYSYIDEINYCDHKQYQVKTKKSALWLIVKLFMKIILRLYQKAFYLDQWHLLFDLNKGMSTPFCQFQEVFPPKDRFWADPVVIQKDSNYYIFVEEYIYKHKKGHISYLEMDQHGNIKGAVQVLEKEYHLSYPFVFRWDGNYYMVPETAENRTISLYKCIDFPQNWEFSLNLMENILAVDTTLFHYKGKWWLFTGMPANEDSLPFVQLFLFFSNDLFSGEWCPHSQNPIISDVTRARPAGRLFVRDGKIFRPSQDCSKTYGYGFYLNEILELSQSEYLEKMAVSVRPKWDKKIEATHTFAREGQLTVVDAFIRRRKFL